MRLDSEIVRMIAIFLSIFMYVKFGLRLQGALLYEPAGRVESIMGRDWRVHKSTCLVLWIFFPFTLFAIAKRASLTTDLRNGRHKNLPTKEFKTEKEIKNIHRVVEGQPVRIDVKE